MRLRGIRGALGLQALPDQYPNHNRRGQDQPHLESSTKKPGSRKILRVVQRTKVRNAKFSVLHLFENDSQFQNVNRYLLPFRCNLPLRKFYFSDKEVDNSFPFL